MSGSMGGPILVFRSGWDRHQRRHEHPAGKQFEVLGNGGEVEYMIKMNAGDTLVYSWEVPGVADPQAFLTEFHGHTEPVGGRGDLMFYEKGPGAKANGSLIAPWQGIHGWYWKNNGDAPVVVRLRMAGFYELVPGQSGQPVKEQ